MADNAGRLLVTGREGIQVWTTEGQFLANLPVDGMPRDLALADAATVWVSTNSQKLVKLTIAGGNSEAGASEGRFRRGGRGGGTA